MLLLGMVFVLSRYWKRLDKTLLAAIVIPIVGGVFGITILTLSFPLVIIAVGTLFRFRASSGRTI